VTQRASSYGLNKREEGLLLPLHFSVQLKGLKTYRQRFKSLALRLINRVNILQYNVQKSKDKVIAPLLVDDRTKEYNILTI
jgi:hypothetical protein